MREGSKDGSLVAVLAPTGSLVCTMHGGVGGLRDPPIPVEVRVMLWLPLSWPVLSSGWRGGGGQMLCPPKRGPPLSSLPLMMHCTVPPTTSGPISSPQWNPNPDLLLLCLKLTLHSRHPLLAQACQLRRHPVALKGLFKACLQTVHLHMVGGEMSPGTGGHVSQAHVASPVVGGCAGQRLGVLAGTGQARPEHSVPSPVL